VAYLGPPGPPVRSASRVDGRAGCTAVSRALGTAVELRTSDRGELDSAHLSSLHQPLAAPMCRRPRASVRICAKTAHRAGRFASAISDSPSPRAARPARPGILSHQPLLAALLLADRARSGPAADDAHLGADGRREDRGHRRQLLWISRSPKRTSRVAGRRERLSAADSGTHRPQANRANDYLIDRDVQRTSTATGIRGIRVQDLAMWKSRRSSTAPATSRSSDAALIAMRRLLMRVRTRCAIAAPCRRSARRRSLSRAGCRTC